MTNPTHIRLALGVLLLTAAFSNGCTPQAATPVDDAGATQSTPASDAGGSTTKPETSSGSGTK
jgi:hypothetical protein